MKLILLLIGFCAYQASAHTITDGDVAIYKVIQESGISPYVMEDQLLKKLEEIFQKLRDAGYDPLIIQEKILDVLNQFIELKGKIENCYLENLVNITVSQLKMTLIPLSVTLRLDWEKIQGNTDFDIQGKLLELIPVFGTGSVAGHLTGGYVYVSVSLTSQGSNIVIRTLDLDFGLQEIYLDSKGLLGGDFGELLCKIINEEGVILVGQFKDGYLENIKQIIIGLVNKALEGKSINDIIDWITGKTTTPAPSTSPSYY